MAVVVRLQGLPVVAGSSDIRRFFSGWNIPYGGVHIIGGEKGEAFIIFATDEDARQAMSYSGGYIKGSRVEFFLSSKTEMQNIIESSRKRVDHSGRETAESRWTGFSNSGVDNLSNLDAPINRGFGTCDSMDPLEDSFHSNGSQSSNTDLSKSSYNQPRKEPHRSDNLYLYICGMPYSATKDDIVTFFAGLQVDGVIMFKTYGRNNGAGVVKFATPSDAREGLLRDNEYMGGRFIKVRRSTEGTWIKNGGNIWGKDHYISNEQFAHDLNKESSTSSKERTRRDPDYSYSRRHTHSRSPPRIMTHTHSRSPPRRTEAHTSSRSPLRRVMVWTRSRSPPSRVMKHRHSRSPSQRIVAHMSSRSSPRRVMARTHSRSPPRRVTARSRSPFSGSTRSNSPHNKEYYIHIKNLPLGIEKRDLRAFLGGPDTPSRHITFLKSYNDKANQEAIVKFRSTRDYCSALGYHKHDLHGQQILLYTISKTEALQLAGFSETKSSSERHHHVKEKSDWDGHSGPYTCVYARNFQYDVTKAEVQKFFAEFDICDNDIYLLYDDKGIGLGEALVKFRSEDEARKAESLNHRRFLGTEVLLRCISEKQMQEFGINVSSVSEEKVQNHLHAYERDQNVIPVDSQGPSIQGKLNPFDSRHPSNDFISSHDQFRGSAPFTEYQSVHGHLTDGRCIPDSNVSSGSDRITLIKLQNIPFRASRNEILDFFHGYMIIPESLSLQHNEYGMFSGEAVIALANYNEAMAVVNELNYRPIGEHKIRLCLV